MSIAGVAAGHHATVEAGMAVLANDGSAADAAIAAVMTSCVAETIMTGLGGGGFATHYDATDGRVTCLDFFVSVPGLDPPATTAPLQPIDVDFGGVPLEFAIGAASVAVPGIPAGCAELHARHGRLPWSQVLAPAVDHAANGVAMPARHAAALTSIAPAMLPGDGAAAYAPAGRFLTGGQRLFHPGLSDTLGLLMDEGAVPFYQGDLAAAMVDAVRSRGGLLSTADLSAYRPRWRPVRTAEFAGFDVHGRADLAGTVDTVTRLAGIGGLEPDKRAVVMAEALRSPPDPSPGDTTNVSVVDLRGNACVVTTTLGIGSGLWPAGTGVHLNSMLGEGELRIRDSAPGDRMGSMMSPLVVLDSGTGRLELAIGAAGASRIRSALVHCLVNGLLDGDEPPRAIARPRWHVIGREIHCEPGIDPGVVAALRTVGYRISPWKGDPHYFGGVSAVGRAGAAGDPRRDGHAAVVG